MAAKKPDRSVAPKPKGLPDETVRNEPLQLRLPPNEIKAIKTAAIQQGMSYSEFMLTCFHAYTKK